MRYEKDTEYIAPEFELIKTDVTALCVISDGSTIELEEGDPNPWF